MTKFELLNFSLAHAGLAMVIFVDDWQLENYDSEQKIFMVIWMTEDIDDDENF